MADRYTYGRVMGGGAISRGKSTATIGKQKYLKVS
jgi:hypothetical protein